MKQLGFVTSSEDPGLTEDDKLVFTHLKERGFIVSPVIWDAHPSLVNYDALIFRSCWNYHRKKNDFFKWLEHLKKMSIPVLNPISLCEWNVDKTYLIELQSKGVLMPKTILLKTGIQEIPNFDDVFQSEDLVIKPAVSLNGHDTYRINRKDSKTIHDVIQSISVSRDVLVQEYMPEIQSSGELSFIFFNSEFSHAIRKIPCQNEFRIHVEYGGSRQLHLPSPDEISQARSVLNFIRENLLYCRVDCILRDNKLFLIELEIIDPMLFLGADEGARKKFADAIAIKLSLNH